MAVKKRKGTPLSASAKFALLAHRLNTLEMRAQGNVAPVPTPTPGQRTIGFQLSNVTGTLRISELDAQQHAQVIVGPGQTSGASAPQNNNTLVDIIVELSGGAGDSANIAITNCDTDKLHPVVPDDYNGTWYVIQYTLKTKW